MAKEQICGIYKITSPSERVYIGQTRDYTKRLLNYKGLYCKEQPRLYASIKKYGFENHKFEIIEECELEQLNIKERYWQDFYEVLSKQGLNCTLTQTDILPKILSEETCKNLSRANKGRKLTEEHKQKISIAHINLNLKGELCPMFGKPVSKERREKQSKTVKEKYKNQPHYNLGRPHTEEAKNKMSKSRMGKRKGADNNLSKKVINTLTGKIYDTIAEATKDSGICYDNLKKKLRGFFKNNTSFKYYTND